MALCVKTGLLLCTLVLMSFIEAGASYSWSSQARLFSDLDSAVATQVVDTCLLSGALEVCQAARVVKGDYSDYFHVCPKDGTFMIIVGGMFIRAPQLITIILMSL